MDVAALLETLSLSHLKNVLDESETVEKWCNVNDNAGRPALLAHFKQLGVSKLAERQSLVNGLGKARREGRLAGVQITPAPIAAPVAAAVADPVAPLAGRKGRILCLHGGGSSGPILRMQMSRITSVLGADYEFSFANGPCKQPVDPNSAQGKILGHFFEGLPVLRWMNIVDKNTGDDAQVVGGMASNVMRTGKDGRQVDILKMIATEAKMDAKAALSSATSEPTSAAHTAAAEDAPTEGTEATAISPATIHAADEKQKASTPDVSADSTAPATAAVPAATAPATHFSALSSDCHTYVEAGQGLRTLASHIREHGPFDGVFAFSQGANLLATWLCLVEAGVLDAKWAAPKWVCCCCATQWGWASHFDAKTEEFAAAIGPALGARMPDEVRRLALEAGFTPSPRLDKLMTCAPLGVPSMHLVGEKDPSRSFSEANVQLYATGTGPADGGTSTYAERQADGSGGSGGSSGEGAAFRGVVVHPNDHMPPRQKDVAEQLAAFAERWSPREREARPQAIGIA